MAFFDRAKELAAPPPVGSPHSVPVPNSEQPGRSAVYRHWRCRDELLQTLDPNVGQDLENRDKISKHAIGNAQLRKPLDHYGTQYVRRVG